MSDILGLARDLYDEWEDGSVSLPEYKSEKTAMLTAIRNGSGVSNIISGTKNGVSYTARVGFSVEDRLSALRHAINAIERQTRPGNISHNRFRTNQL
jgi:hypothetical protein